MNLILKNQANTFRKALQVKPFSHRFLLPLLLILLLTACSNGVTAYRGTCTEQTQQFLDDIYALVINDLTPVIEDGFKMGPTTDVMKRLDELDSRIYKIEPPECDPRTQTVKDKLLLYMVEVKNYFMVVAGRAVYGDGQVQGQLAKMNEAGQALEVVFDELKR